MLPGRELVEVGDECHGDGVRIDGLTLRMGLGRADGWKPGGPFVFSVADRFPHDSPFVSKIPVRFPVSFHNSL